MLCSQLGLPQGERYRRDSEEEKCSDSVKRRRETERSSLRVAHSNMDRRKVLGWFPRRVNFGEVKGHCMWTMTPTQRLLKGRGQGHCGKGTGWLLLPVMVVLYLHGLPITPGRNALRSKRSGRRSQAETEHNKP